MIEARTFVGELDTARAVLGDLGAESKGHYEIHDIIYRNKVTSAPLVDEFLRLRHMPENIWDDKSVILAIKKTRLQDVGKVSDIPTKVQFDRVQEAKKYFNTHLSDTYIEDFEFRREGWQYYLPNGDVVDLEIVEDKFPTIEFKSETSTGIRSLIEKFKVAKDEIIIGPSVVAIRELIKPS